jgi:hypothetical protein
MTARRLGVSRSELYAKAVREFVERHRQASLTEQLNEVYSENPSLSELDPVLSALQTQSLDREDW